MKKYEEPIIEIEYFDQEDVITTSGGGGDDFELPERD